MSRSDELRAKFKKNGELAVAGLSPDFLDFSSRLYKYVLKTYNASTSNSDYERKLYKRFKEESPKQLDAWLKLATENSFNSVSGRPKWVNEPSWCYYNGAPLEFFHQFEDDDGITFYVFRGKRTINFASSNDICELPLYMMCAQTKFGSLKFTDNLIS
jgi:hypothetical protein